MLTPTFKAAHQAAFFYGTEGDRAGLLASDRIQAIPAPTVPTDLHWGGLFDSPGLVEGRGSSERYGIGDRPAQIIVAGGKNPVASLAWRLTDTTFLTQCLPDGSGNLKDLYFLIGTTGAQTEADSVRFAVCNSWSLDFRSGEEVQATAELWGQAVGSASGRAPTTEELATKSPFMWHDVRTITLNGVNIRQWCSGVRITESHGLKRKSYRPDFGTGTSWSLTTYATDPGNFARRLELTFDTPEAKKSALGYLNGESAITSFEMLVKQAVPSGTAPTFSVSATSALLGPRPGPIGRIGEQTRNATPSSGSLSSTLSIPLMEVSFS